MVEGDEKAAEQKLFSIEAEPHELNEGLGRLASAIRQLPDIDPPAILLPTIMKEIRSAKMPWWYRVYRWSRSQRTITFTPLQFASIIAMLVSICGIFFFHVPRGGDLRSLQAKQGDRLPIVLSLKMPGIQSAAVVGTFNDWHAQGYEMQMSREKDAWTVTVWLPEGRYEYAFVLDGSQIIPDPSAEFYQDDGFGNQNAVLIVASNNDTCI